MQIRLWAENNEGGRMLFIQLLVFCLIFFVVVMGYKMIANPTERYYMKKVDEGKLDVARNMLAEGMDIADVVRFTGLSEEDILNAK